MPVYRPRTSETRSFYFLSLSTLGDLNHHLRSPITLRPPCCEVAQASYVQRLFEGKEIGIDRKREREMSDQSLAVLAPAVRVIQAEVPS